MVLRWSGAMLKKLGLQSLVATTETEYVEIAKRLADDRDQLGNLRATLRQRVAQSPLCDARRRARQMKRVYRWMWTKWRTERGDAIHDA